MRRQGHRVDDKQRVRSNDRHCAPPRNPAASEYDRAAANSGVDPAPSQAGRGLRPASVLLASARFVGRHENKQLLALLAQLAALTDAVTRLRESQDRAAQASAARRAAEHLRVTSAQRIRLTTSSPTATATRTRRPSPSLDLEPHRPGFAQSASGPRRGPRLG